MSNPEEKQSQSMLNTFDQSFHKVRTEPSEAVLQFSKDFDLMRKKFGEMHTNMNTHQESMSQLTKQVA
jgi:hypothetical protein